MPQERNKRATYYLIAAAAGGALVLALVAWALLATGVISLPQPPISVPSVTGLDVPTARSRLGEVGLLLKRGPSRFSETAPAGSVVDQLPGPGALVQPGTTIVVAISAGSDTFPMPDVTGLSLASATAKLRAKGLAVQVERVASTAASGTVLTTVPGPGVDVTTADTVTLEVSGGKAARTNLLLPFDLGSVIVVLDPDPAGAGPDVAYDLTLRLRSLLEASGARVVVTRSAVDTSPPDTERQLTASEASPTIVIGMSVAPGGPGGLKVGTVPSSGITAPFFLRSVDVAKHTISALAAGGLKAASDVTAADAVLAGTPAVGIHVRLGSSSDKADALHFADPAWMDSVSKALYQGIGQSLAPRSEVPPSTPASGTTTPSVQSTITSP